MTQEEKTMTMLSVIKMLSLVITSSALTISLSPNSKEFPSTIQYFLRDLSYNSLILSLTSLLCYVNKCERDGITPNTSIYQICTVISFVYIIVGFVINGFIMLINNNYFSILTPLSLALAFMMVTFIFDKNKIRERKSFHHEEF